MVAAGRPKPRGVLAAELVVSSHTSVADAARRFGVSLQAVREVMRRRFPLAEKPRTKARKGNEAAVRLLATGGERAVEIARATGLCLWSVYKIAKRIGVDFDSTQVRMRAALELISKGVPVERAVIEAGVSRSGLYRARKRKGLL